MKEDDRNLSKIIEILTKMENLEDKTEILDANLEKTYRNLREIKEFFENKNRELLCLDKESFKKGFFLGLSIGIAPFFLLVFYLLFKG
jgi:hypothetical protein